MPKGRTKSAQEGGSSLAEAFKRVGSRVKKRRESAARSTYKVPQEIVIFGERVRMFQDTSTETSLGIVAFREEYFPYSEDASLHDAQVVFAKIFGAGSKFIPEFPTYPCDETDRSLLREGLVNRWTGLREEITQAQAGALDMAAAVLNERVERFGKLTSLINTMDEIYKANSANCFMPAEPGVAEPSAPIGKLDEQNIRDLLRKFTFLILQAQNPIDGYNDTLDAAKIVSEVAQVDMDQDTMDRYIDEYDERNIPPILMGLATGTTSAELLLENRNSAEIGALLSTFNEQINTFLTGASNLSSMERNTFIQYQEEFQKIISDVKSSPSEKITKGVKFILRVHRDLIVAAKRLRSTAESETKKSSQCDSELKKLQLKEATLNQEIATLKSQIDGLTKARTAATAGLADKGRTIQSLNEQLRQADVKKQGQLVGVQAALAAARADRERIEGAKAAAEAAATAAEKSRSEVVTQLQNLTETNNRLQKELVGSKNEIQRLQEKLDSTRVERDRLYENLQKKSELVGTQSFDLREMRESFQRERGELERQQEETIAKLQSEHSDAIAKAQADTMAARAQLDSITQREEDLQNELLEARASIASKVISLKENENERARLAQEANELKQQIESTKAAPAEQIDTDALSTITKGLEQINEKAQEFETKNNALKTEIAAARAAAATANQEKERIEGERREVLERIAKLRSEFNEELIKAQQAASSAGQELEATKAAHLQEIQTLVENLERNQAEKLEALRKEAEEAAREREVEIQRIGEELAAKNAEVTAAQAALAAAQGVHTQRIAAMEASHNAAINRINSEKAELEVQKNALQSQLEAQARDVVGIRTELENAQAAEAAAKTAAAELQRQLQAAGTNRAELEAQIAAKQTEVAAANQRVQELQASLVAAEESLGQTQANLSESEKAYRDLEAKYKQLATSSRVAQAAAAKQADQYANTLRGLQTQLADGQQRLSELEGTSQASASEREQLASEVERLKQQIQEVTTERDLAAGQIAAAQAAKSGAEAALAQGREAFQGQLQKATAKHQQEMDGLFGKIMALAEMVERDQMPKKGFQNQNFASLYERMKGLKESSAAATRSSEQRSLCYLNYFVEYFLRQFFFLGEDAEKEQIYKMIGDAIRPIDDRILPGVVHNLFEGLKGEEEGQRAGPLGATAALFSAVSDPDIKEKLNEYFLAGFPSHSDFVTREVFGQPYSVVLALFVLAARKYLLRISSELRTAQCGLSNFMMTPAAMPIPVGRERGISFPMTEFTNVVSPRSRSSSTNTTRRLRRPAKMMANAAHAVAAREEEEARRLEARAQEPQ